MDISKTRVTCFKSEDVRVEISEGDVTGVILRMNDDSVIFADKPRFRAFLMDCLKVVDRGIDE